jgi:hypothetical protein
VHGRWRLRSTAWPAVPAGGEAAGGRLDAQPRQHGDRRLVVGVVRLRRLVLMVRRCFGRHGVPAEFPHR